MTLTDSSLLRSDAFLDGAWTTTARRYPVRDPATGEVLAEVARCGAAEVERATAGATEAFASWRRTRADERAAMLREMALLMDTHAEDLARLVTLEEGKPLAEARGEIRYASSFLLWFAEEARRAYGETVPSPREGQRLLVLRQPVGVSAAITPWNFPSAMITRKLGAALAAGCTMVLKPAEATPLSALALAELAQRAGVPAGVFQVVTGAAEDAPSIGEQLCADPRIRKLSFTGSTEVGKILLRQCAGTVKKVSLELGGNAPFIVFDDADIEAAVKGCIVAKLRNGGQTCVAANRIFVQRGVYERFAEALGTAMGGMKVGPGLEEGVELGPLVDAATLEKVEAHVADARERGARLQLGGKRHALGRTFYEPTLLTEVPVSAALNQEETFGPVAGLIRFDGEDEVLHLANDTRSGLAAYFYARDVGRVFRVAEGLEYGMVGVNTGLVSTAVAPFGGVKESGLGREGSRHGLDDWTELKYVALAL